MDTQLYIGCLLLLAAAGLLIWDNRGRLGTAKSLMAALVVGAAAVLLPRPKPPKEEPGLVEIALEQNERVAEKLDVTIEKVEEALNEEVDHGPPDLPSPVTSSRIRAWAERLRAKPR